MMDRIRVLLLQKVIGWRAERLLQWLLKRQPVW
jgi:hypothetical protein